MRIMVRVVLLSGLMAALVVGWDRPTYGEPYELSKNDVMDPKTVKSSDIALFGVKLGDPEAKAVDVPVLNADAGHRTCRLPLVEQEALFIFLLDQRKPTGPMAGVRIQDG